MNTEEAKKQLKPYLIGDLTPKEEAVLTSQLAADEAAREFHERYQRQILPILNQPEVMPSEGVLEALFAKAKADLADETIVQPPFMKLLRMNIRRHWKVAAVFLIAFGATIGVMLSQSERSGPTNAGVVATTNVNTGNTLRATFAFGDTIKVAKNQIKVVNFGDGVSVRLSAETEVRFESLKQSLGNRTSKGLRATLLRGDLLVSKTAESSHGDDDHEAYQQMEVVSAANTQHQEVIEFAPSALVYVSYTPQVAEVRKAGQFVYLDLKRQSVEEIADAAKYFGKEIVVAADKGFKENFYFDLPSGLYDWARFQSALKDAEFVLADKDGALVLEGIEQRKPHASENVSKKELWASVNLETQSSARQVRHTVELFGGNPSGRLALEDSILRRSAAIQDIARVQKLLEPSVREDGSLVYSAKVNGEIVEVTLRRDQSLDHLGLEGVKGTFVRAIKSDSGSRVFYQDGEDLKFVDLEAN